MLNRMDLEEKIKGWSEPEQFIVRELYDMKARCPACTDTQAKQEKHITALEGRNVTKIEPKSLIIPTSGAAVGGGVVVLLGQYAIQAILQRLLGG